MDILGIILGYMGIYWGLYWDILGIILGYIFEQRKMWEDLLPCFFVFRYEEMLEEEEDVGCLNAATDL